MGGRGSGSYTAGGASVGGFVGGGAGGTDLNVAGWTPEAGKKEVHVETTISSAEDRIKNLDHEQLVVIGNDGYVKAVVDGGDHSVGITPKAAREMRGNIATHNHPTGGTLSPPDVINGAKGGVGEIRAISKRFNKTYSLKATSKANGDGMAKAMQKAEKRIMNDWQKKIDGMQGRKYKSKENWENQVYKHYNTVMGGWLKANAGKYGYVYSD